MSKPLRFYFASFVARLSRRALLLLGRNATHLPGVLALKLCPDFLKYLEPPKTLIGVTGTNGKTTVTNLISDVLTQLGFDYVSNNYGSNIVEGVITALLTSTTLTGKNKREFGVLEIDERASIRIFPYLKPDYLVVTNLFRDSYRRNAHHEYIRDLINAYLPAKTKLIVNSEDVVSSYLGPTNSRQVFSVARLAKEVSQPGSLINDVYYCPVCDNVLIYDFVRYHHIGQLHCPHCGFTNLKPDVAVTAVDYANAKLTINEQQQTYQYQLVGNNITDIYNMVAAITVLRTIGITHQQLQKAFTQVKVTTSRFETLQAGNKTVVRLLAKGQNPVGTSRTLAYIKAQLPNWGKTAVIFVNEDYWISKSSFEIESFAWLYDTDFEYLNHPQIQQIILGGQRTAEYEVRLLLAGIKPNQIFETNDQLKTSELINYPEIDTVVILYDTTNIPEAKQLQQNIFQKMKQEKN